MINSSQVFIVDSCVFPCKSRCALGSPLLPSTSVLDFTRGEWPVWKPPEKSNADNNGDQSVNEEHPLKSDKATLSVHFLKAGRDETYDGGRHLSGCEVTSNAFAGTRRRVEEREVVRHTRPHARNDDTE